MNTLKFGNGQWATKEGSTLAYNDENGNFKPLPFTFDRASSATRVNKDGLIETVGADQPRVDYLNDSKGALKLEPSRTNLLTYSEELSNWTNIQNVTVTDKDIVSPNGSQNASRINETAVNGVHRLFLNPTVASAKHTFSVFLKAGTRKWAYLRLDGGTFEPRTWFDLENGVLGTVNSDHIASIEDFGNGWYRCSVTIAGTTYDTTPLGIIAITTGNNVYSYAGDVNEYIYAWSAQLEQGSYATSYIPTQGSAVTRTLETSNIDNLDDFVLPNTSWTAVGEFIKGQDTGSSLYIVLAYYLASSNLFRIRDYTSYVRYTVFEPSELHFTSGATLGSTVKWAFRAKADGSYSVYVGGVSIAETSGTFRALDAYNMLGNAKTDTKGLKLYNTALTDAELIALTS